MRRLRKENLVPADEADKHTLLRRLYLDLIGLPPNNADISDFVNDTSSNAYEKAVDRLLKSEHFGEHMARFWLDAARYADTNGYQYDLEREQWVWRDWVIHALNTNMLFDQPRSSNSQAICSSTQPTSKNLQPDSIAIIRLPLKAV